MTVTDSDRDPVGTGFSGTDFCDPRVFDEPGELYTWLRGLDHLHYDEPNNVYIAARYQDVFDVSRDDTLFCSKFGVRPKIAGDMSIITLDGEEHTRQRRLINKGFTPRQVRNLTPHVRELSRQLVEDITARVEADGGELSDTTIDFVEDFAIHVPLIIICELLGLDPSQRMHMYRWSDDMMAGDGHVEADDPVLLAAANAFGEFCVMALDLIADRRANPADDLISILTEAFDDGELAREHADLREVDDATLEAVKSAARLDDNELLSFLTVLLVAGNETTRNAISGGLVALSNHPDQRKLMFDNLDDDAWMDRAVDELVRYVTPVLGFIRTVTAPTTLHDTELVEGDRVLMLYGAANRDESQFYNPDALDLTRDPNPHLGFGIGAHYCLGSNLAKMEVRVVFQELLSRWPDISVPEGLVPPRGESTLVLALKEVPAVIGAPVGCPAHGGAATPDQG